MVAEPASSHVFVVGTGSSPVQIVEIHGAGKRQSTLQQADLWKAVQERNRSRGTRN